MTGNNENNKIEEDFEFETGDRGSLPLKIHIIAGSFAGVMEHVAIFPIDTIKTHLQSDNNLTSKNIIRSLNKEGGMRRFWKGSSVIAGGCIPAHAAYFSIYEYMKVLSGVDNKGFQFFAPAITGACSTFFHDLVITPCDGK
jgi:solute carrier family 25 iron transporter 28/37